MLSQFVADWESSSLVVDYYKLMIWFWYISNNVWKLHFNINIGMCLYRCYNISTRRVYYWDNFLINLILRSFVILFVILFEVGMIFVNKINKIYAMLIGKNHQLIDKIFLIFQPSVVFLSQFCIYTISKESNNHADAQRDIDYDNFTEAKML